MKSKYIAKEQNIVKNGFFNLIFVLKIVKKTYICPV